MNNINVAKPKRRISKAFAVLLRLLVLIFGIISAYMKVVYAPGSSLGGWLFIISVTLWACVEEYSA